MAATEEWNSSGQQARPGYPVGLTPYSVGERTIPPMVEAHLGEYLDSGQNCHIQGAIMAAGKKPGGNTGNGGGIFQEQGPRGGKLPNFATVPDNKPLPPTTKPGHTWAPVKVTPDSKR